MDQSPLWEAGAAAGETAAEVPRGTVDPAEDRDGSQGGGRPEGKGHRGAQEATETTEEMASEVAVTRRVGPAGVARLRRVAPTREETPATEEADSMPPLFSETVSVTKAGSPVEGRVDLSEVTRRGEDAAGAAEERAPAEPEVTVAPTPEEAAGARGHAAAVPEREGAAS